MLLYQNKIQSNLMLRINLNPKTQDTLFIGFIFAFLALYVSVAIPHDYRDENRTPQWRMHHGWDEGQNVARALSIVQYGYRDNPIVPREANQFYLMLSAISENFFDKIYDLPTRIVLALRIGATLSILLYFFLFYFLCRMVSSPLTAFLSWICFYSASWAYLPTGTIAKEDALCSCITLLILIAFVSLFQRPKRWKLYLSAFLIGLGGATKQYPLLLSLVFPLYFWKKGLEIKQIVLETFKVALVVFFSILLANPNFYLTKFHYNSPLADMLFEQQAKHGFTEQLGDIWNVIQAILLSRYQLFYTALFLLIVFERTPLSFKTEGDASYRTLIKNRGAVLFFLFLYYGISLYKQSYYASIRYFMIGEMLFSFLFALLLERLLTLKNTKWKAFALGLLCIEALLQLHRANFNFALQTSGNEQAQREKKHSTFDDLETYLEQLDGEKTKNILSHWYVDIPARFKPKYIHAVEIGFPAAEVYLERVYGFSVVNSTLNKALLEREKPTLFFSLFPLHERKEDFLKCFSLLHTFTAMEPVIYPNYFTALLHFHQTRQSLSRGVDPYSLPAGSTIYAYDTRSCFQSPNSPH